MTRKTLIALLVGACLGIAGTLLVANTFADTIQSIGTFFAGDNLEVPDSTATSVDSSLAVADCTGIILPDSIGSAIMPEKPQMASIDAPVAAHRRPRVVLPLPDDAKDSEAFSEYLQERVNQAGVEWYESFHRQVGEYYSLKVTVWSATKRPVIKPVIEIDHASWYRDQMQNRVNSQLTRSLWKGRFQGTIITAAILGVGFAVIK